MDIARAPAEAYGCGEPRLATRAVAVEQCGATDADSGYADPVGIVGLQVEQGPLSRGDDRARVGRGATQFDERSGRSGLTPRIAVARVLENIAERPLGRFDASLN